MRVEYVGNDEFVANGNGQYILLEYPQSSQFEQFDTAAIEFYDDDLKKETSSRPYFGDDEITYYYVLDNPKLIRPAGPGEPTFA